jgi:hypothetical protein
MSDKPSKQKKKAHELYENVYNSCLSDGFTPWDEKNPYTLGSALIECARRTGHPKEKINEFLSEGLIVEENERFNPDDPHKSFVTSLRNAGVELTSDDKARRHLQRLTDQVAQLRRTIKQIDRDNLGVEEVRSKIYKLKALPPDVPSWVIKPKQKDDSLGIPITVWSDWHYGETVSKEEMGGKNEYNLEIADQRIKKLVEKTIASTRRRTGGPNDPENPAYPGIVICLGGDMLSGDNLHDELTDTNEVKVLEAFSLLQGRMIWALEKMADEYGNVDVECAFGNHGRNTIKPRNKSRAATSYEFLFYTQLERYFSNHATYKDKITFHTTPETGIHFTVQGHRYYLTHGDALGVKGGNALIGNIGPIRRGTLKIGEEEASIDKGFDTVIMGHFHPDYYFLPATIVNGTLKGWDEYARVTLRAPYAPASQVLFFNFPKVGPNEFQKIVLGDPVSKSLDAAARAKSDLENPFRIKMGGQNPAASSALSL